MEEQSTSFFRFEDLRIYAKSINYAEWLLGVMQPKNEAEKNLFDSFCKSAYDIALNVAEGSSRSKNQFEHYLKISKTAIRECVVYTSIAANMGYINEEQKEHSRTILMELTRMIGALIISLQRSQQSRRDDDLFEDADDVMTSVE